MANQFILFGLIPGFVARLGLIVYSVYHDSRSSLKYTDIDYQVFSDAAEAILTSASNKNGTSSSWLGSPYDRATYRYTPLVALILTPNHLLHACWGKALFGLADLLIGVLLYRLPPRPQSSSHAKLVTLVWLLNPFVMNISTRGSSESLLGLVVIGFLYSAQRASWDSAACLLGLAVHLKIYPFIYATAIWARLSHPTQGWLSINRSQFRFGAISLTTFSLLNLLMYIIWGHEFIESSYLYHLSRQDHRHNFSPYFYPIYLSFTSTLKERSTLLALLQHPLVSFVPQMSLSLALGFYYGKQHLPFACFIQTYVFVVFNKVVTFQYFMWYLWFIPLLAKEIKFTSLEWISVATIWVLTQAIWLSQAYKLEFLGEPRFRQVWMSSIGFMLGHGWIIGMLILAFSRSCSLPNSPHQPKKLKKT